MKSSDIHSDKAVRTAFERFWDAVIFKRAAYQGMAGDQLERDIIAAVVKAHRSN